MPSFLRIESAPELTPITAGSPPALHALSAADPAVLLEIVRPGIGLSIWARDVEPGWSEDAVGLRPPPGGLAASGEPSMLARRLGDGLAAGCPAWFREDVARMAGLVAVLAASAVLTARFDAAAPRDLPEGLRLCCRYGAGGLAWSHPGSGETALPGGTTDPFAVLLLKGARSPVMRRRALRLMPDPAHPSPSGPILSIEPVPAD